jgi:outer membrane receptor protein involved in Fe transport
MKWKPIFLIAFVSIAVMHRAIAQTQHISGKVVDDKNQPLAKTTVKVKNGTLATETDDQGKFSLSVPSLPVNLEVSHTEYETASWKVNNGDEITITLQSVGRILDPVVLAPSRTRGKFINSPVSIEVAGERDFINSPKDPYGTLINKKGLDETVSSLTYRTFSTRGFNGSGSSRVNQIMDGMDNQAPGLNFSVGNFIGLTDLDINNIEILPGASSALYGPGGMNGTILVNSKSPFVDPGFSIQIKNGVSDIGKYQRDNVGGVYDYSLRWAKVINNRLAFKVGVQYFQANDWLANDSSNYLRSGASGKVTPGTRQSDPNYDGVNVYGDETSVDVRQFVGAIGQAYPVSSPQYNAIMQLYSSMTNPTPVSRTGYNEIDVIDPKTKNIKLSGAVHYKLNGNLELILAGHWATGNTVYTGNNRYALKDIKIGQYKMELRHKNWFLRGYTTQENAGEAYSATITSQYFNEAWKPSFDKANPLGSWYFQYAGAYIQSRLGGLNDLQAHNMARTFADQGRPAPGSSQFKHLFDSVRNVPIPNGGLFVDKSQLWMGEGQYDFTNKIKFADIIVGGNLKEYVLNSKGTIFIDTAGALKINEWGAYAQATKKLFNDRLVLSASGRYDKNQNFTGRLTPRFTALIKIAKDNNLRLSYQTAYKFPTTQQQWVRVGVGNVMLLGGLPWVKDYMKVNEFPTYVYNPSAQPTPFEYKELKAESIRSFEVGYKSLIKDKLLIDMYAYFGKYTNFLGRIVLVQPTTTNEPFSIVVNSDNEVNTWGAGLGLDYKMARNYFWFFNTYTDNLTNVPSGFEADFNTPKYRVNAGFGNSGFGKTQRIGFNVNLRWQDSFFWEGGGFADGNVKAYTTLDAQVNYKLPKINSMVKVGGTNVTNKFYQTGFGNPYIGGMYYVTFAYNVLKK